MQCILALWGQHEKNDKFHEYSKDCKQTWLTINSVLGRRRKTVNIPDAFVSNGKVFSGAVLEISMI